MLETFHYLPGSDLHRVRDYQYGGRVSRQFPTAANNQYTLGSEWNHVLTAISPVGFHSLKLSYFLRPTNCRNSFIVHTPQSLPWLIPMISTGLMTAGIPLAPYADALVPVVSCRILASSWSWNPPSWVRLSLQRKGVNHSFTKTVPSELTLQISTLLAQHLVLWKRTLRLR